MELKSVDGIRIKIGQAIKNARNDKGLRQETVADKLNITQSQYGKIERGEVSLTIERLMKLSEIFQVSLDDLLNGHKSNNSSAIKKYQEESKFFADLSSKYKNFVHEVKMILLYQELALNSEFQDIYLDTAEGLFGEKVYKEVRKYATFEFRSSNRSSKIEKHFIQHPQIATYLSRLDNDYLLIDTIKTFIFNSNPYGTEGNILNKITDRLSRIKGKLIVL